MSYRKPARQLDWFRSGRFVRLSALRRRLPSARQALIDEPMFIRTAISELYTRYDYLGAMIE
jgi:hypothetical protein